MKNVHFIINPSAGQDEPILSMINKIFSETSFTWDVSVTKAAGDAARFAQEAVEKKVDIVAVYGGDGSAVEVAGALFASKTPLAIIPGGTANVLAKELQIPVETEAALTLIKDQNYIIKAIDMAKCNDTLFVLRLNAGFVAEMVTETDREMKNKLGQLAYGVTAVKQIAKAEAEKYLFTVDGKNISVEGVALVVANSGNVGFTGLSYLPDINMSDGLLDIIVIKRADIASLVAMAGSTILQKKPEEAIEHWQGKHISLEIPQGQTVMLDDVEISSQKLTIEILPQALRILVPKL